MATENKIKYFENREDWRKWLMDNFETEDEIWFVFPLKSSGEKSIAYNDAVEEALCFEWIDSTIKPLDKEHRIQRFTPRKPKSTYSQANKERLKWLLANKMIHPELWENNFIGYITPFTCNKRRSRRNHTAYRCLPDRY